MAYSTGKSVLGQYLANSLCACPELRDLCRLQNIGRSINRRYNLMSLITHSMLIFSGGSVTLGVLADMWEPNEQEYAVAFLVLSSVGGSVVGAVVGGFVEAQRSLPWIFWVQLIAGGVV